MASHNGMKKHLETVMRIRPMSHSRAGCHLISLPMAVAEACLTRHCLFHIETGGEGAQVKREIHSKMHLVLASSPLLHVVHASLFHFVHCLHIPPTPNTSHPPVPMVIASSSDCATALSVHPTGLRHIESNKVTCNNVLHGFSFFLLVPSNNSS